ncbi:MFS general substrate transporter [Multifurca ochricompacta]|uniref:MFS general substrate transporter n=1 Tax=Multifurca ochricompacta TaxID=376703 RepID=A0AAD4M621_9AGAM|nr:MFS general substrate transporter [Multifurca ochricompacta]
MSLTRSEDPVDEETPILPHDDVPQRPTPLPTLQVLIVLLERIAETTALNSISPYINQLISELPIVSGDSRRVGYYTGIILSLYFAAEAVTVLQWNRLSDRVGRKPILLSGLLGTIVSITLFGLSRSFWALVVCRFLNGALNGNIGVTKSMLAELTDKTNVARGFSMMPLAGAIGQILGSFIGGIFARPQDRWPDAFSHPFWAEYPYFLPCLVVAAFAVLQFVITAVFLEETVDRKSGLQATEADSDGVGEGTGNTPDPSPEDTEQPLPLRSLLTRPVVICIANYAILALLDIAAVALIPLIWSTPIELGGLNLSPASIGLWMSGYGFTSAIFQFVFFPHIVGHLGPRRVIIISAAVFAVIYLLFPLENLVVRGVNAVVGPFIILQLLLISFSDMGFSSVFMYISTAAPNKRSLGATNGLAQTVVSIQRAVGPAIAASLFAFSLENNILGGNFVYVVLLFFVYLGLHVAVQLPKETWNHNDKGK